MNTERGVPGLPAASSSASSPVQLEVGVSPEEQSFTAWQGQAESFLTAHSVPVISGGDISPLKLYEGC